MMTTTGRIGALAMAFCGKRLEVQVLRTPRGFYLGTADDDGPCSRESEEYFPTQAAAELALATGDWTQRTEP